MNSIINQHARPRFAAQPALPAASDRPVLFSTDLDLTLIKWQSGDPGFDEVALQRNARAIRQYRPQMAVHINTGRGLHSFQNAVAKAAHIFKQIPVDFLSLNNGMELYVNRAGERSDRWIAGLKTTDQDPGYQAAIARRTHWNFEVIRRARESVLARRGFAESIRPDLVPKNYMGMRVFVRESRGRTFVAQMFNDQPGIKFFEYQNGQVVFTPALGRYLHGLINEIKAEAEKTTGPLSTFKYADEVKDKGQHFGLYILMPRGVNKGLAVKDVLDRFMLDPQAVISAGDHSHNDTELLTPWRFPVGDRGHVRNYPILSGQDAHLTRKLARRPRTETVPQAYLDTGIQRQMGKVLDRMA